MRRSGSPLHPFDMAYSGGKYVLDRADDTALSGTRLHRIRALRDIPEHGVLAGDLGGFVQSERNLSQTGAAWIGGNAVVLGEGRVEDDAIARDQAVLSSYAVLRHRAAAGGQSRMDGQAIVQEQAQLTDSSHIGGCARVGGTIIVGGFVSLTYDWNHQTADDLPWSLESATLDSPGQIDRLHEAVEIDMAYRRVLELLGAKDLAQCRTLLDSLLSPSGGHLGAMQAIARAVGGTFLCAGDGISLAAKSCAGWTRLPSRPLTMATAPMRVSHFASQLPGSTRPTSQPSSDRHRLSVLLCIRFRCLSA